jgi:hypothetical protein
LLQVADLGVTCPLHPGHSERIAASSTAGLASFARVMGKFKDSKAAMAGARSRRANCDVGTARSRARNKNERARSQVKIAAKRLKAELV